MKILFYGTLILTGVAAIFLIFDLYMKRKEKKKRDENEKLEKSNARIYSFLNDEKKDLSLAHVNRVLNPDEVKALFMRKGVLDFYISYSSPDTLKEVLSNTELKKFSPLNDKLLMNALARDREIFETLQNEYGSATLDKILANSFHYQAYLGNEEKIEKMVDSAMSGDEVGQDYRLHASLLWFGIHSGKASVVQNLLRLGKDCTNASAEGSVHSEVDAAALLGDEHIIDLVFKTKLNRKKVDGTKTNYFEKMLKREFSGEFLLKYAKILHSDGFSFNPTKYQLLLKEKGIWEQILEVFPLSPEDPMLSGLTRELAKFEKPKDLPYVSMTQYFEHLIGYDSFREKMEFEMSDWLASQKRTRMKLFWGAGCIGKTELCLRLSGIKSGYRTPPEFSSVHYITPSNLESISNALQRTEGSLILIDDYHTVADQGKSINYNIHLHKNFLIQLKTIVSVTNHFWIFLTSRKSTDAPTDEDILRMFGEDLGGYIDHTDWALPRWGVWELVKYADSQPEMGRLFDEEGLANIVSRLHAKGMGLKEMNRVVSYATSLKETDKLNITQVTQILEKIGA